jgi:hypothetical protein
MSMTYTIEPARNLVLTTGAGVLTDDDVMAHRRALSADPQSSPQMRELSDIRQVTDFQVTPAGIRIMVAADVRMVSAGEPDIRSVGVFRNDKDAAEWLGIA